MFINLCERAVRGKEEGIIMPSLKVRNLRHGVAPSGSGNAGKAGRHPIVILFVVVTVTNLF